MALKALLDSLDGLDEGTSALYVQKDGKFVLDVEGVNGFALEDVGNLKKALNTERSARKQAEDLLKPYRLEGDEGYLDATEAAEAIAKVAEFADLDPEKEASKRAEVKIAAAKKAITEEWEGKVTSEKDRNARIMKQLGKVMIDNEVLRVLGDKDVKGNPKILLPLMRPHIKVVEEDEVFRTVVYDEEGEPMLNGKGDPASIREYAVHLREDEDLAGAFGGSEQSGGGGSRDNGNVRKVRGKPKEGLHGRARIHAALEAQQQS